MARFIALIAAMFTVFMAEAETFTYRFNSTPLPTALREIMDDHPGLDINFIYNELENYSTSVAVKTDDPYDALRQTVGLNPVTVIKSGNTFYVEALQHGKFVYTGQTVGTDNKPVEAATIMLLAPKDSTVLTYGITDEGGRFSIPCDREGVIGKFSCLGYKTVYKYFDSFNAGVVRMNELPIRLKTVTVEGDDALLLSDKSKYRPTQRQKNASQTATDLLVRMAIPQLDARLGSTGVTTATGQPVAMYIDYVPASESELKMMKVTDVKTVEFLEFPSDPRFQGNKYVINFRMVKYEFGGYVKTMGTENFIANSGFGQANVRFVKNKMTYDLMGYGFYDSNNHYGIDQIETFRLPGGNGDIRSFQRESMTTGSKYREQNYAASFRAMYSGEKLTVNNQIEVGLDRNPHNDNVGVVRYTDDILDETAYRSQSEHKAKYLNYSGYYYLGLSGRSSLSATMDYSYSHTDQSSRYNEKLTEPIENSADDNTHKGNIRVNYNLTISDRHSILAMGRGLYENNRTAYCGSVDALDHSTTKFGQIGASYSFNSPTFYASFGFGWNWLSTRVNDNNSKSDYPFIDGFLSYVPNKRNSFGSYFHYSVWPPSSNYKSENVIHVSPLLWHTGNPLLKSYRSYDFGVDYTFIPARKFNLAMYSSVWLVGNRSAFVYEAIPEGVVRTIRQPIGYFRHFNNGLKITMTQLEGKLQLTGKISQLFVQNGAPYNVNHSYTTYYLQALYYLGNFNFALSYKSKSATDNYDSMSGFWTKNKDTFTIQAGWSNAVWNIRITAQNLQRWNWREAFDSMNSSCYSVRRWTSDTSAHALVQLSATFTFGYGKRIDKGNDITKQANASSGILK